MAQRPPPMTDAQYAAAMADPANKGIWYGDPSVMPPGRTVPLPPAPVNTGNAPMPVPPMPPQQGGQSNLRNGMILNDPGNQQGLSPIVDPTAEDPSELSPTTMVLNYLKARGYQPTTENVRRALEANAWNPGAIPGLRSDVAPMDYGPTGGARGAASPPRWDVGNDVRFDTSGNTSAPPTQPPPTPNAGAPPSGPGGFPVPPPIPPAPNPVGAAPVPVIPPPPAGAAASVPPIPPPPDAISAAIDRAIGGGNPALAPGAPNAPAPPQLPAPSPQLALPAPNAPARPQIAAPPEVPRISGPPPQLALPAPDTVPPPSLRAPPISPANPVLPNAATRALPRIGAGVISGGARGGIPGAIAGGAAAAAPEIANLGQYIAKGLHLY